MFENTSGHPQKTPEREGGRSGEGGGFEKYEKLGQRRWGGFEQSRYLSIKDFLQYIYIYIYIYIFSYI